MATPARHERLINTVAPKAHFQAERLVFNFLHFQVHGNKAGKTAYTQTAATISAARAQRDLAAGGVERGYIH